MYIQNGACIAHNHVVGMDHEKGAGALDDIQIMIKSIHSKRGKSWAKFGFEPGPTGKAKTRAIYRLFP